MSEDQALSPPGAEMLARPVAFCDALESGGTDREAGRRRGRASDVQPHLTARTTPGVSGVLAEPSQARLPSFSGSDRQGGSGREQAARRVPDRLPGSSTRSTAFIPSFAPTGSTVDHHGPGNVRGLIDRIRPERSIPSTADSCNATQNRSSSDRDPVLPLALDQREQERAALVAGLADGGDVDGRVVLDGALVLADPAADALDSGSM